MVLIPGISVLPFSVALKFTTCERQCRWDIKMKATLCKNKNGYGNKYSLVLSLLFSLVSESHEERWLQEVSQSLVKWARPLRQGLCVPNTKLHINLTCLSWKLDSDNNLFKVVCFWGLVFVVLAISVML